MDEEGKHIGWKGNLHLTIPSRTLAKKEGLITINEGDGTWDWTDRGKPLEPILNAMHTMNPVEGLGPNHPKPGDRVIRTATFSRLVNYLKAEQLPTSFSDEDINNEDTNRQREREEHNTPPPTEDTGDGGSPSEIASEYNAEKQFTSLLALQPEDVRKEVNKELNLQSNETLDYPQRLEAIGKARNSYGLPFRTAGGTGYPKESEGATYETDEYTGDDTDNAEYGTINEEDHAAYRNWITTKEEDGFTPAEKIVGGDDNPDPWVTIKLVKAYRDAQGLKTSNSYNYDHPAGIPPNAYIRGRFGRLTDTKREEFLDDLRKHTRRPIAELLSDDSIETGNLLRHAMDMQGKSLASKWDMITAWDAHTATPDDNGPSAQSTATGGSGSSSEEVPPPAGGSRGSSGRPDFSSNKEFDFNDYIPYIPRKMNGPRTYGDDYNLSADTDILLPKDEKGEDYDPLDKGKNMTVEDITESLQKLRKNYMGIHQGGGDKANLGKEWFPTIGPPNQSMFDKEKFTSEQITKFNELNTNKAITEAYLMLLSEMEQGIDLGAVEEHYDNLLKDGSLPRTRGRDTRFSRDGNVWSTAVWPEEAHNEFARGENIPPLGMYQWYQSLEGADAKLDDLEGADAELDDQRNTRDAAGNLNFYIIPGNARDPNMQQAFLSFYAKLGVAPDENDVRKYIGENSERFSSGDNKFVTEGSNQHFDTAYSAWTAEFDEKPKDGYPNNQFINWLEEKVGDKPRFQHVIEGTTFDTPPSPPPGGTPGGGTPGGGTTGGEDPRVVPEAGTSSHIDKEELIRRLMQQEDKHGFDSAEDRTWHQEDLQSKPHEALLQEYRNKVLGSRQKLREEGAKGKLRDEQAKDKASTLGDNRRKELIEEYINTHRDLYNHPLDPRLIKVLQNKSDKDLQQTHEKLLQEFGAYKRGESANLKEGRANNIDFDIKSLAPLQEHLTKEDIMMQVRRLIHHNVIYGKIMDADAKKVWKERMGEAHQLADAANMNLDLRIQEDMQEAEERGDFGSTNWLERVGEAHVETQTRRGAHRDAVSRGGELRTSVNYKPHIIAKYDDYGNFQGFRDLKSKDEYGNFQAIDQFNLRFNDDNYYHFHGLDPEKVKKYQRYLTLTQQAGKKSQPGDIPLIFGPPPTPTDPELAELKKEVFGAEYKDVRDRLSTIGKLPTAQQVFYNKFGKDTYGRPGKPINPDGSEMNVPRFYQGVSDTVGEQGWYHPESESWVNPHRYRELINHMGGQPNSGRVIVNGKQFYGRGAEGKSNPTDLRYAFAVPTTAKQQQFRSGYDDQGYYVDDTGGIAHAHDNFEAVNTQNHDQPQTENGVIHDWNAQQIGNQYKANPDAFVDPQSGKLRQVAVIDTQPTSANPIQNMWLALAESLGREEGSALERRDKKKQSGWEWHDKKLGQTESEAGTSIISRTMHPFSSTARNPLSQQELGQEQWWSRRKEAKQKYYDVLDAIPVPVVSWLGHLALGLTGLGKEKPEDKVIRRIRQGYKQQAMTEKLTRETASGITINGRSLSDQYVAPGEQKARDEDYQELKRYFINQNKFHSNKRQEAMKRDKKNPQNVKDVHTHGVEADRWVGLGNKLTQYDSKMPHHWKDINDMYNTHLGKVNQALPAEASMDAWGTVMRQPSSNRWGATMRQPDGGQPTQTKRDIPSIFGSGKQGTEIPSIFGVGKQGTEVPSESSQKSGKIPLIFSV